MRLLPMRVSRPRVAVVGHVEWVQFARVPHVPRAGEVVHAREPFEEPAGGGAVAAVQLARLAGGARLITALGGDDLAGRSVARLRELGVETFSTQAGATRRAATLVDGAGERTIITYGPRLEPRGEDRELPWAGLAEMDAVYFTAGDLAALHAARAARVLVASPRAGEVLGHGVELDALVLSGKDPIERREAERVNGEVRLVVSTDGARGGVYRERAGGSGTWSAARLPGAPVDAYGCGDSFAAGLTYALGAGLEVTAALALAARCGAVCLTGHGPYERQLLESEV
ncbi:MAG TPA: PfkB family carbohydrate kinase [Solirubrobacteraceae bacterium]